MRPFSAQAVFGSPHQKIVLFLIFKSICPPRSPSHIKEWVDSWVDSWVGVYGCGKRFGEGEELVYCV